MRQRLAKNAWLIFLVIFFGVYLIFFRTAEVNGFSMEPTYNDSDLLFLYKTRSVKTGDIVVVYNEELNRLLCKRVIGVAGDHITISNTGLTVNSAPVNEEYVSTQDWYLNSAKVDITVPVDSIFAMGDNRVASNDSRKLGCMAVDDITGVVVLNITKAIGLHRSDLVRIITGLFVLSVCLEFVTGKASKGLKAKE